MNTKGFSIVEILVSIGILGLVGLGVTKMIIGQSKSISYLEDRLSRIDLEREINLKMINNESCNKSLMGFVAGSSENIVLKDSENNEYLKEGDIRDGLKIQKIKLDIISPKPNQDNVATLIVETQRVRKGGGRDSFKPIDLNVKAHLGTSLKIDSCQFFKTGEEALSISDLDLQCSLNVSHKALKREVTCCTMQGAEFINCTSVPSDALKAGLPVIKSSYRVDWSSSLAKSKAEDGRRPKPASMDCAGEVCCAWYDELGLDCMPIPNVGL